MGVTRIADWRYSKLVEEAAARTRETGCVDLCDLAGAAAQGFCATTFTADVEASAFSNEEDY